MFDRDIWNIKIKQKKTIETKLFEFHSLDGKASERNIASEIQSIPTYSKSVQMESTTCTTDKLTDQ